MNILAVFWKIHEEDRAHAEKFSQKHVATICKQAKGLHGCHFSVQWLGVVYQTHLSLSFWVFLGFGTFVSSPVYY